MIRFSIGHGQRAGHADRTAEAEGLDAFCEQVAGLMDDGSWWSPHEWAGLHRSQDKWLGADLIAVDVDHHVKGAEGKDEHAPLPDDVRQRLVDGWAAGAIIGHAMHTTPRGLRVVVALPERATVATLYRAASTGAALEVERSLRTLLPGVDLRVDPASWDTARYLWAPNARVGGVARAAQWLVADPALDVFTAERWASKAVGVITKGREDKRSVDTDLRGARDRWLKDHPLPEAGEDRACPACKHVGCWGTLPDSTTRWWCWSANHDQDSQGCGRKADSGRGWFGDALDLAAHARGIRAAAVLEQDGYLVRAQPGKTDVLLPGAHQTGEGTLERGVGEFVNEVLGLMPEGRAFRRGITVVGLDEQAGVLRAFNATTVVAMAENTVRPVRWFKDKENGPFKGFTPMNGSHGRMILDAGESTAILPIIDGVATFPTYARLDDGRIARVRLGYNPDTRMYLVPDKAVDSITGSGTVEDAQRALADLLVDFPFADDSSMENVALLMLTLMMRPACDTVPMFHVGAPLERTGKTKMLRECVGILVTGKYAPVITYTDSEEETRKRLDAMVLEGQPFCIIDNLPTGVPLNSPSLAAALTSSTLKFRVLGRSEMQEARNTLTLATTGNNSKFSAELVKRTVPITMVPKDDHPERRTDFAHPDVGQYTLDVRARVLSLLVGAVDRWLAMGRPSPRVLPRIGGFERWWHTVCGVAEHGLGLTLALSNRDGFARTHGDGVGDDAQALVNLWVERWGVGVSAKGSLVYEAAANADLFAGVMDDCGSNEASRRAAHFNRHVLDGRMKDRPVSGMVVRRFTPGHYVLQAVGSAAPEPTKPTGAVPEGEQGRLNI